MILKISHKDKEKLENEYYDWLKNNSEPGKITIDCPYNFMAFLEMKKFKKLCKLLDKKSI